MYNVQLESFIKEVNKFSAAKFILVEAKLAKFLSSLSDNDAMYSLIEHCVKDFEFEVELKRALVGGKVQLPNKAEKIIALVFCLLVEVDSKKIDFYKFLRTYFNAFDINASFAKFIEEMIVPFKNMVVTLSTENNFSTEEEIKEKNSETKEKAYDEMTEEEKPIGFFAIDMHTKLRNLALSQNKCEMSIPIFDAMKWAIDNNNKPLFKSLSYSLIFITKNKTFSKVAKQTYLANYEAKIR